MGRRMKPGQLVLFTNHEAGGGFAPAPESMGLIISIHPAETCPRVADVLLFDGTVITEWEDELEVIHD